MGDEVYASGFKASAKTLGQAAQSALNKLGRQALHAAELGFEHPVSRDEILLKSEPPADFLALKNALKAEG